MMNSDHSLLEAALVGYQEQITRIERAMADIRKQLGHRGPRTASPASAAAAAPSDKPKRKMSAAARKRIAAAQKKRWAEYKKQKASA